MKWYESNPERLEIEKRLLARYYPRSKLVKKNGQLKVIAKFRMRKDTYTVVAKFSRRHPYSPMEIKVVEPRLKGSTPHRYASSQLCVHTRRDVGPQTTAKVYLDWTRQWIQTYERWLDDVPWPKTNHGY